MSVLKKVCSDLNRSDFLTGFENYFQKVFPKTIFNQKFILSYLFFRALQACFTLSRTQNNPKTNKQTNTDNISLSV